MRAVARTVLLALAALVASGTGVAEAQLWKPAKKPATTTAPARPARPKPARTVKRTRRAPKPPRRRVVRDDPPRPDRDRDRPRPARGDDLPELDDAPVIVVELPARGER